MLSLLLRFITWNEAKFFVIKLFPFLMTLSGIFLDESVLSCWEGVTESAKLMLTNNNTILFSANNEKTEKIIIVMRNEIMSSEILFNELDEFIFLLKEDFSCDL